MIALGIMQFISLRSAGQMTMPDYVCTGQTRHYYVIPGPDTGSTYTWWVDGNVMSGYNASEFIYTWDSSKTYLIQVQELSADGCPGPKKSGQVSVNPQPEIQIIPSDTLICNGECVTILVQNPSDLIWGKWIYDLIVEPEAGITGNTINSTYTSPTNLSETLFNNDREIHKVVYRFIPGILTDEGIRSCEGKEVRITVWIQPMLRYNKEISDYNGFNISCHGKSDGFIRIDPTPETAPFTFKWSGPDGFSDDKEDISGLKAGRYILHIDDTHGCFISDTFTLREPGRLGMRIEKSVSIDGEYNIDCFGDETGSISVSAINNVGEVGYLWSDGYNGSNIRHIPAGNYNVITYDSNGCQTDTTISLTEPKLLEIFLKANEPHCAGSKDGAIFLDVNGGVPGYSYLWSDNSNSNHLENLSEGIYKVTVTDKNGCSITDSVRLNESTEFCLRIPDAFSPDGDGINDVWNIRDIEIYPDVIITIYNRWGMLIWKSERGYPIPWNGKSGNDDLPVDSYHYFIEFNNGFKPVIGNVTIVR